MSRAISSDTGLLAFTMLSLATACSTWANKPQQPSQANSPHQRPPLPQPPRDEATCAQEREIEYEGPAASMIQDLVKTVTENACALANPASYPQQYNPTEGEEFDFIVIGGGTAGSTLARRLTEISNWRVLLLEYGGYPTQTSEVPALYGYLQKSDIDWQYQTDPDEDNCLGMVNNSCNWPRGKVLGGGSAINYMIYVRGNRRDYDRWDAEGCTGWAYKDVLPYFKKLENMRAREVLDQPYFEEYHNVGGPLSAETWPNIEVRGLGLHFAAGMKRLGYELNPDVNGPNQTGFAILQGALKRGRRCSAAVGYLQHLNRPNLFVSMRSLVSRVLVNEDMVVYGVEFYNPEGEIVTVLATKEVILSAGAINTPQLMMLSGLGPREELERLGIDVLVDLPAVGKNLQDHPLMNNFVISVNWTKPSPSNTESMFNFLTSSTSMYSSVGMVSYAPFIPTPGIDKNWPNLQLFLSDYNRNDTAGLKQFLYISGIRSEIGNSYLEINKNAYTVHVLPSLLRPYSTGAVMLKSADPRDYPILQSGYFNDDRDFEPYLHVYEFVKELIKTKEMQDIGARVHEIFIPGCSQHELGSRDYRVCALRYMTSTTYHQCCTCAMGPEASPASVINPYLKVKGVSRLRIIDASVMPRIISGNLNTPTIMIAEKGADLIKATWMSY